MRNTTTLARMRFLSMKGEELRAAAPATRSGKRQFQGKRRRHRGQTRGVEKRFLEATASRGRKPQALLVRCSRTGFCLGYCFRGGPGCLRLACAGLRSCSFGGSRRSLALSYLLLIEIPD